MMNPADPTPTDSPMNDTPAHVDAADALASPVESFRRSRRDATAAAEELTATPGARRSIYIDVIRIDHPVVAQNTPYGFLAVLTVNHPAAPIIAAADHHTGTKPRAPDALVSDLLQQAADWITFDAIVTHRYFSCEDVYRYCNTNGHEYFIRTPWSQANEDWVASHINDSDDGDEYPQYLRRDHPIETGRDYTVFILDNKYSTQYNELRECYTVFDTNLPSDASLSTYERLVDGYDVTHAVRDVLRPLLATGITEAHCYHYLTAINNAAAATLQQPAHHSR